MMERDKAKFSLYDVLDATLNDSDKSFVVPAGEVWKLNWAHVELISTATVGNRQIAMNVKDASGNVIYSIAAGIVQAASLTRHFNFAQGVYRETAFVANEIQVPIPMDLWLSEGFTLQFLDSAAIAVAADDMTVAFQVSKFVPLLVG